MSQHVNGEDRNSRGADWRALLAAAPGLGAALLPVLKCPACWTAYAGLVAAFGLGALLDNTHLLVMTATTLCIGLASLVYRAPARRGYGPALLGTVAVGLTLVGKFALASAPLWYVGIALFVGAALWNAWPQGAATAGTCASCASQDRPSKTEAHKLEVDA